MKNEFCHSVCFSGLPWAWRCTSCSSFIASSYLLRHVLTRRLRTVSWRLIRRKPKLLTINSSNHDIKFIKLCSRNRCSFINIVVAYVLSPRRLPGNPRFSALPLWTFAAIVSKFNPALVPLYFAEKNQHFASFPLSMACQTWNKQCAKLVCLPPGKSILHRWFTYSWIDNLSCGTDKLLLSCCKLAMPKLLVLP